MTLTSTLLPSVLAAPFGTADTRPPATIDLGWPGFCPGQPRLVLPIFDDSGSVTLPGGGDPVGNRYGETRIAFKALHDWCTCRKCLAGVLHFDTPHGDVAPGRLGSSLFQATLRRALRVQSNAGGTSFLGSSLDAACDVAEHYPKHEVRLIVLTDWELFDEDDYVQRLLEFPGKVLAIGLNATPPEALSSESVATARIDHGDAPGAVARAVFGELTVGRRGRRGGRS